MSAPRTNAAPTEQPEFLRNLQARLIDASFAAQQGADAIAAALRKEPAPPADVEAVLAKLSAPFVVYPDDLPPRHNASREPCDMLYGPCICGAWHQPADDDAERTEAATLLRRYAQAVAEKDAEIARLTAKHAAFDRIDGTHLESLEKKMQAVEALCARAEARVEFAGTRYNVAIVKPAAIRKILREEH